MVRRIQLEGRSTGTGWPMRFLLIIAAACSLLGETLYTLAQPPAAVKPPVRGFLIYAVELYERWERSVCPQFSQFSLCSKLVLGAERYTQRSAHSKRSSLSGAPEVKADTSSRQA